MSEIHQSPAQHGPEVAPSLEPWLIVCLLAFVPSALIVILPHAIVRAAQLPLYGSTAVLLVAGLVMLWRTEQRKRHDADRRSS